VSDGDLTIWKYLLLPGQEAVLMPEGAKMLYAREQQDTICVWAIVNPANPQEARGIRVFGTGHSFSTCSRSSDD
jgi:hypothetical protein